MNLAPWQTPGICIHCDIDPCTKTPEECMQDAHDTEDDRRYHEQKEVDL
jgi:hypothetical protein